MILEELLWGVVVAAGAFTVAAANILGEDVSFLIDVAGELVGAAAVRAGVAGRGTGVFLE